MSGTELRARRGGLGLSQEELARAIGVTSTSVSRWERARQPIPHWLPWRLDQLELAEQTGVA